MENFVKGATFMSGKYYQPFSLRISEDLHRKLKQIAAQHKRSENKEIEYILEEYVLAFEREHGSLAENEE